MKYFCLLLFFALLVNSDSVSAQTTCESAYTYASCDTYYAGSTIGVVNDNATSGATYCGTSLDEGGQHWYLFYYPFFNSGTVTITTAFPETNYDTKIHVYTGDCGNLTCVSGDDDSGGNLTSSVSFTGYFFTQYYIRIGGYGLATGQYGMQIFCPTPGCNDPVACNYDPAADIPDGSCFYSPANDGFYAALPLGFPGTYYIDNRCTYEDFDVDPCTGSGVKDVWYYFYYTGGTIFIYTSLQTTLVVPLDDTAIMLYDYYNGYPVACNDDYVGLSSQLKLDCSQLTVGNLYFLQVCGFNGYSGMFYLVSERIDSPGCTNPSAGNYDPCASVDNGSCDFNCVGDMNADGAVNVSDLLIFAGAFGTVCY